MAWAVSADPVNFDEAIAWFGKRVRMTRAERDALDARARRRAFFISNVAKLDLVNQAWTAVDRALKDGTSLEQFKKDIGTKLRAAWGGKVDDPGWRLETIFRTNLQHAYGAGRYRQATHPDVVADRPVWMFDAILDGRETEICKACDGTKLSPNHDWWRTHTPPLHFNCRSSFITLTKEQAGKLTTKLPVAPPQDGFGHTPLDVDPVEASVAQKLAAAPKELAAVAQEKLAHPPLAFVEAIDKAALKKATGAQVTDGVEQLSREIFKGKCPSPESWADIWKVPAGYKVQFDKFSTVGQKLSVEARVLRDDGAEVTEGSMTREFFLDGKTLVVHNAFLRIDATKLKSPKDKVGEELSRSSLQSFMQIGVKRVDVEPAWVGRYTWPSFGFSWPERENGEWKAKLRDYLVTRLGIAEARADRELRRIEGFAHEIAEFEIDGVKVRTEKAIHGKDVRVEDVRVGKGFLLDHRHVNYGDIHASLRLDDPKHPTFRQAKKRLKL